MPDASSTKLSQQRGAEQLLTEVLTQLGDGVAILAADGTILYWSPRLTSLTGYTASEANARGWGQLFDLSTPRLTQLIEQTRESLTIVG